MLELLKTLFSTPAVDAGKADAEARLRLTSAALLLEVSKADYQSHPQELAVVRELLTRHFNVTEAEMDGLLAEAGESYHEANSLHPFTRFINDNCNDQQKYQLIQQAWHVAWADGSISKYEEHLIRHLAELIYVPHSAFIRAKLTAQSEAKAGA